MLLLLITVQVCRVSWVEKTRRKKETGNEPTSTCVLLPLASTTSFSFYQITVQVNMYTDVGNNHKLMSIYVTNIQNKR